MTSLELAKRIWGYINPFYPNLIINADREVQKEFVNIIGNKFKADFFKSAYEFYVLHFNGIELMHDLMPIMLAMEQWSIKKGINYDIEREYRNLQQTNIINLSKEELKELYTSLWELEKKRDGKTANRFLINNALESYLASKIYKKIISSNPDIKKTESHYLFNDKEEEELEKVQKYIELGDIESYKNIDRSLLFMYKVHQLCNEQYKKYHNGYFILISNGEAIVDYDLHGIINGIIAERSANLSMNLLTAIRGLYRRYTNGGSSLQETHDYHLTNVEYVKK